MGRIQELLIASSVLLLCLPLAVLLTLMLLPVWSWIGVNFAIPAVGPSGPAPWCFILVYALMAAVCLGVIVLRWRGGRG